MRAKLEVAWGYFVILAMAGAVLYGCVKFVEWREDNTPRCYDMLECGGYDDPGNWGAGP